MLNFDRSTVKHGTHWQKKWPGDATVRVVSISPLDRALGSHCEVALKIFSQFGYIFFDGFVYFMISG